MGTKRARKRITGTGGARTVGEIPERLRGSLANRYEVEAAVGSGGMATVYLARDLRYERKVAIKVLRSELVNEGPEAQRFLREIRIAARLSHPNILPLLDSGTIGATRDGDSTAGNAGHGVPFYVMPFVEGESLKSHLQRLTRIPLEESVAIGATVARALDYAHRQNVIHRDIKPENILLHQGQPVVTDFGIARAISAAATDEVTARGLIVGTPAYMSPEQVGGEPNIDGRADLYALACVLFEMITGSPPFRGDSVHQTLMQQMVAPIPSVRTLAPVPAALDAVLARALAKEASQRYPTGAVLAEALEVSIRPSPTSVGAPTAPPRSVAVIPFINGSDSQSDEYLSDGFTEELIAALTKVRGLEVAAQGSAFAKKGTAESSVTLGRALGVEAVLEGGLRRSGDRIRVQARLTRTENGHLLWSDVFERGIGDLMAVEQEIAHRIVGALKTGILTGPVDSRVKRYTESSAAHQLYLKGRYAWNLRTRDGVAQAIRYFEQAIEVEPKYARAYAGLSDAHALGIDYRASAVTKGFEAARMYAERAIELDDELAEAHTSLAWVHFIYDWNWPAAKAGFERAITLDPRYPTARQWYSWYLVAMGRLPEAIDESRIAVELDPASVSIRRSLGWVYYYARRPEDAVEVLEQALLMNPTSDETQWLVGLALAQAERYEEAEAALRESHANSQAYLHALASMGWVAALRGRRGEAEKILLTVEDAAKIQYVSPTDFVRIYLALGRWDETFAWIDRVIGERRGWPCYIKVDPMLDPIRKDPRFATLLERMKLDG